MRKFLILMIIALSLLCLASCGDEEGPTVPSTNVPPTDAPADSAPKQLDQCRWAARIDHEHNGFSEYYLRVDGENSEFGKTIWTSEPYFGEDSPGFQVIDGKIAYGLCGTMIDSAQVVCEDKTITVTLRYCVLTLERTADHQLTVVATTEDQIGPTAGLPVGTVLSWEHSAACTSCVADTKCDYCGELLTAAPGHSYANGSCTRCGQSN